MKTYFSARERERERERERVMAWKIVMPWGVWGEGEVMFIRRRLWQSDGYCFPVTPCCILSP